MAMTVETARLRLEPWDRRGHAPGLAAMNADHEVMHFVNDGETLTRVESQIASDRIAEHWRTYGFGLWAAFERATDRMVGFAGVCHPLWLPGWERTVEVGWRLRRDAWGRGYATEAGRAGLEYAFGRLGLAEVVAFINPGNTRSRAVAGRLGLELRERIPHPQRPQELDVWSLKTGESALPRPQGRVTADPARRAEISGAVDDDEPSSRGLTTTSRPGWAARVSRNRRRPTLPGP